MPKPRKYTRRDFVFDSAMVGGGVAVGGFLWGHRVPRVTFCGAAQQVSGSCYLLDTHYGEFLVDCGLFFSEGAGEKDHNLDFPYFNPANIKAVFITHAHADHIGKLSLLYAKGFRGSIFSTDCTRDLAAAMLSISGVEDATEFGARKTESSLSSSLLNSFVPVSYGQTREHGGLSFRFSEAGHILGSAMVEIWVSGRKFLFSGDMGPDYSPLTRLPQKHVQADFVLVESTYGAVARQKVDFKDLGKRISEVIARGGDVLLPAFVLHKTQSLIYVIHQLKKEGVIPADVPVICDSTSAQKINHVYNTYASYYRQNVYFNSSTFYEAGLQELSTPRSFDFKKEHRGPVIYISASGMLDHANSPKHFTDMAGDPRNAVFLVGWQSPGSVGGRLLRMTGGDRSVIIRGTEPNTKTINEKRVKVALEVIKWGPGFSSHAPGQQILEWISDFKRVGTVCVVHGEKQNTLNMAEKLNEMGVHALAPAMGQTIKAYPGGTTPEKPPPLGTDPKPSLAITDV